MDMVRQVLFSVCHQPSAGEIPLCSYCQGIYPAIAISFPVFVLYWTRASKPPPLRYFVIGGVVLMVLMALEFTLSNGGMGFLSSTPRTLVGFGNGVMFGTIGGFFWHYFFKHAIPLKNFIIGIFSFLFLFLILSMNLLEALALEGIFLRFYVANTLIISALIYGHKIRAFPILVGGLILSFLQWWIFYATT
jgi:hypothetical protein